MSPLCKCTVVLRFMKNKENFFENYFLLTEKDVTFAVRLLQKPFLEASVPTC